MDNLLFLISQLPTELQMHINEFNVEHRKKMRWVLQDIKELEFCEVCERPVVKHIYSERGMDMICCSMDCVDEYRNYIPYSIYDMYEDDNDEYMDDYY